jgi:bifunctional N-acetylglucosamine-1-phosphate-uridyltransferase/glucosamine-1-phosphate-acetyltransferase GlmU-like protein
LTRLKPTLQTANITTTRIRTTIRDRTAIRDGTTLRDRTAIRDKTAIKDKTAIRDRTTIKTVKITDLAVTIAMCHEDDLDRFLNQSY